METMFIFFSAVLCILVQGVPYVSGQTSSTGNSVKSKEGIPVSLPCPKLNMKSMGNSLIVTLPSNSMCRLVYAPQFYRQRGLYRMRTTRVDNSGKTIPVNNCRHTETIRSDVNMLIIETRPNECYTAIRHQINSVLVPGGILRKFQYWSRNFGPVKSAKPSKTQGATTSSLDTDPTSQMGMPPKSPTSLQSSVSGLPQAGQQTGVSSNSQFNFMRGSQVFMPFGALPGTQTNIPFNVMPRVSNNGLPPLPPPIPQNAATSMQGTGTKAGVTSVLQGGSEKTIALNPLPGTQASAVSNTDTSSLPNTAFQTDVTSNSGAETLTKGVSFDPMASPMFNTFMSSTGNQATGTPNFLGTNSDINIPGIFQFPPVPTGL